MSQSLSEATLVPEETPEEVAVQARLETRAPSTDPTLGIRVDLPDLVTTPKNRLVVIGDSLSQGVQSGAAFATDLSFPAIIARELGEGAEFRYPRYPGLGGLPLNIEMLLRGLERSFGARLDFWEIPEALFTIRSWMDQIEDYWERGPGTITPTIGAYNHALAMYGWDIDDVLHKTAASCFKSIGAAHDDLTQQLVEDHASRAALRVYPAWTPEVSNETLLDAARHLGDQAAVGEDGIETLIVFLGSNNCLGSITQLRVQWSADPDGPASNSRYTVSQPRHFRDQLSELVRQVSAIRARHVIWCTVPHVTIAPLALGIGQKVRPGSRYFPFYTRPWIGDDSFDPGRDKHITGAHARAVDAAIDLFNTAIEQCVHDGRQQHRDWYLLDTAGLLDRLASRRYLADPAAAPSWWSPYPLPPALAELNPIPNSRFLTSDGRGGRANGGLFSLDGIHPTTIAYGLLAQETITIMRQAGVAFLSPTGQVRPDPVRVDFDRLVQRDTLITHPPQLLTSTLHVLSWADEAIDLVRRCVPF